LFDVKGTLKVIRLLAVHTCLSRIFQPWSPIDPLPNFPTLHFDASAFSTPAFSVASN